MNRQQIIEQAETMLALLSTLDANEVAQVVGTALVLHTSRCSQTSDHFFRMWRTVNSDTNDVAHDVYLQWKSTNVLPQ